MPHYAHAFVGPVVQCTLINVISLITYFNVGGVLKWYFIKNCRFFIMQMQCTLTIYVRFSFIIIIIIIFFFFCMSLSLIRVFIFNKRCMINLFSGLHLYMYRLSVMYKWKSQICNAFIISFFANVECFTTDSNVYVYCS